MTKKARTYFEERGLSFNIDGGGWESVKSSQVGARTAHLGLIA